MTLTEFEAKQQKPGSPCSIEVIKGLLTKDRLSDLDEALKTLTIHNTTIAAVLKDWGHEVAVGVVSRHRRGMAGSTGGCKCVNK